MTENAIVISAVFFAFLVAVAITIFIVYKMTNRVLKNNDHYANIVMGQIISTISVLK